MLLTCKVPWGRKSIFEQKFAFKFRFPVIFFSLLLMLLKIEKILGSAQNQCNITCRVRRSNGLLVEFDIYQNDQLEEERSDFMRDNLA